jgi:hypothetical protein
MLLKCIGARCAGELEYNNRTAMKNTIFFISNLPYRLDIEQKKENMMLHYLRQYLSSSTENQDSAKGKDY